MPDAPVVIIDAGSCQWLCGYDDDSGPGVVLPGGSDTPALLNTALKELDTEPSEVAILLSEYPGTLVSQRAKIAAELFACGVLAVHIAAAPRLALLHTGFDTGVLVDVGERSAFIVALYAGFDVFHAATVHPLAARAEGDGPDERDHVAGVREALLRTVALADASIREGLLSHIVLAGGGTMQQPSFRDRLQEELEDACAQAKWKPRVVANADRRLTCWLGGAVFSSLPSNEDRFVTQAEVEADPSLLEQQQHWYTPLACLPIDALEAH